MKSGLSPRPIAVVSMLALSFGASACHRTDAAKKATAGAAIDTSLGHAPANTRIKVEVLNATRNRGLARRVSLLLRDRGFDVVAMGTTRLQQDATVVLDRSNHPQWAALIAAAVGGRVEERPDTSRYLDATVLIGTQWTPPPMPFYP